MSKKYQNILVPFDGSKHASKSLDDAVEIAKKFNSKIHLLMAVDIIPIENPGMFFGSLRGINKRKTIDEFINHGYEKAHFTLQRLVEGFKKEENNCGISSYN